MVLPASAEDAFRAATFNLENYLIAPIGTRPAKSPESRVAVRNSIGSLNADIVALQEIGGLAALETLRSDLAAAGHRYPYAELAAGHDPHIAVALLSRFPLVARRSHTNESFLLFGKRFHVSRGFLEVDLEPRPGYRLTVLCAHLKSRRVSPEADESSIREQEAILLRGKIDRILAANPKANLLVMGDLNDHKDSKPIRTILGRGNTAMIDTRPTERSSMTGDPRRTLRQPAWTHFYAKEDSYSRVDYILISRGLYHEWIQSKSWIPADPDWGLASDHRPVTALFSTNDRGPGSSPTSLRP